MQFDPLLLIQQFIQSANRYTELPTRSPGFWPGIYQAFHIRRDDAPYFQDVCLYESHSAIIDPLFDAGESSFIEGLEEATGMTAQGYFTTEGIFVAANPRKVPLKTATLSYNGYYYALYLLR